LEIFIVNLSVAVSKVSFDAFKAKIKSLFSTLISMFSKAILLSILLYQQHLYLK
jgi:hypothetical protein